MVSGAIFVVVVLVLLGVIGFLVYQRLNGDPTKDATAGQCLGNLPEVAPGQDQEATGGKIVDCGDAAAVYQIESRLDNQTDDQAETWTCAGLARGHRHLPRGPGQRHRLRPVSQEVG